MANSTGGFYANAPNAATLNLIYNEIAGNLQTAAGVNTSLNLNFQNVNLTGVTVPGAQALSYVPQTQIIWQNGTTTYQDQSSQWNAPSPYNQQLSFNIGTINLTQTWQATFTLRVLMSGSLELFGNQSPVSFDNGASMTIPPVFITGNPNLTAGYGAQQPILLSPLLVTQSGTITQLVPLQWTITYPGVYPYQNTATERLYYSTSYQDPGTCAGPTWSGPFTTITDIPVGSSEPQSTTFDVRALPAGTYYICVDATAPDAYTANTETGTSVTVGSSGKSYIQLQ